MNYKKKLFTSFTLILVLFTIIIIFIQLSKEKRYQTDNQKNVLTTYTLFIEKYLQTSKDTASVLQYLPKNIRLSIINKDGKLLYDNIVINDKDHSGRPEISAARLHEEGFSIRKSNSTDLEYLYCAKKCSNGNYIRVALPYIIQWSDYIQFDNIILYIVIILFFITIIALIYMADKHGKVIQTLKGFITAVEKGEVDYNNVHFPDTKSGEIGSKIISIYKQLEDSKLETNREKDRNKQLKHEMTNNIAHELKTPVSSIRGYLEILLENKNIEPDKKQYFLERSYAQTLRLTDLINDVALITKLEESSELFPKEKIDLQDMFDEAVTDCEEMLSKKGFSIENKLTDSVHIAGNRSLIYSIFKNLIENSVNYAGENIHICFEVEKEDDLYYYFKYYDTGCGVKDEYLDRIFNRFVRIDEGRSRKNGGTGLGLAIVKHAVQFHQGDIHAQNRIEGGLEFYFSLKKR